MRKNVASSLFPAALLEQGALLANEYPLHGFVVDIVEAAEHLFNNVRTPSDFETSLVDKAANVKIGYIETPHYEK